MDAESVADKESLEAWTKFLYNYANGRLPSSGPPPRTIAQDSSFSFSTSEELGSAFDKPVYNSIEITPDIARRVREYYHRHSFLPPPRAPLESLREQCIQEYDLYSTQQKNNVQAVTDLVSAFFGGICTFTLFRNNVQEFIALSGPQEVFDAIGLQPGQRVLPETSLCGHSVLYTSGSLYVPNLAEDWRYSGNPYADNVKGIKSYYGSVVWLQVDPASTTDDRQVAIGVINSMHLDKFLPPLNEQQQKVMTNLTRMLETQLRATWEGQARTREAQARRAISDIIESTLVQPLTPAYDPNRPIETSLGVNSPSADPKSNPFEAEDVGIDALELSARKAARRIRSVLGELDVAGIVDLRSMHLIKQERGGTGYISDSDLPMRTLAWETSHSFVPVIQSPDNAVTAFLNRFRSFPKHMVFDSSVTASGLEQYLPSTTVTHVAMPFFTGEDPLFLFIIASSRPFYSFRAMEVNFLRSLGVVLRAQVVQSRVLEADAAKTAFLSSISHELRTPMHGVLSGLQLIRDAMDDGDYKEAERLLQMAESSGHALEHILNDVLDFGSFTHGRKEVKRKVITDLGAAALAAARTCSRGIISGEGEKTELLVELEDRDWRANIDEAGFQRILFNGLTNAIKFTKTGRIILSLSTNPDNRHVTCRVTDSGPGIETHFLNKLFQPFTKANSFTPGAGLGLYITKSLVTRLGGEISLANLPGRGAVFTVTLPVDLLGAPPANPSFTNYPVGSEVISKRRNSPDVAADLAHRADTILNLSPPAIERSASSFDAKSNKVIRVLVVDDNVIGRKILVALLNQLSRQNAIETAQAVDGVEAVASFRVFKPHLVLTDVSMPRMDGITAASEMRQVEKSSNRARCRIYAITGLGSSDPRLTIDALRGSAALDGWLIKGQDKLSKIKDIVAEVQVSRKPSITE